MLARLARVLFAVALVAVWQAAIEHPIEHLDVSHEAGVLCDTVDALTACAPGAPASLATPVQPSGLVGVVAAAAPLAAEAPPFLSQGPPLSA